MAIPNTTYGTAEVISSIPFNKTVTANDAGITYTLWYKYVSVVDEVLGVFGYGTGTGYNPQIIISELFGGFPDQSPEDRYYPSGTNLPVTFHARIGKTYYFEFRHTGAPASSSNLVIDIIKHVSQSYPDESLMIPDDTWSLPGAILSPTTGEVLKFVLDFWSGEEGDSLTVAEGGEILTEDYNSDTLKLCDKNLNLIASIPVDSLGLGGIGDIIAAHTTNPKFYVGLKGGGPTPASFTTISKTGVVGSTKWILPEAGLTSFAVNPAETVAYITGQASSVGTNIRRWDLINSVELIPQFVVPIGQSLIYIMKNGNIVVTTYDSSTRIVVVREYNSVHTLLHTYTYTNIAGMRMKHANDNPISMWAWTTEYPFTGMSHFIKLRLSDGVELQNLRRTQYESGCSEADISPIPQDRFGHSFSCPIFILYQGSSVIPPVDLGGLYFINPNKPGVGTVPGRIGRHDSYNGDNERKIPNPTFRIPLIGE